VVVTFLRSRAAQWEVLTSPALRWRALGAALLAGSAAPVVWTYLVGYPDEIWQVDLEVYREGARALVTGTPLYDLRTPPPQFLPFTYPPFAALAGLPLLLGSLTVAGWAWTVLQLVLLWVVVGRSFRALLDRFGDRRGLVQGAVAAGAAWFMPVTEGIRFGQVNAVIVALCLVDLADRPGRRLPRGALVGLAAAVKLTPALFWVHWTVTRRWRTLAASVGTAAGATLVTALLLPGASAQYWTDALLDPDRLGPNAGTSNQSLRGLLLRIGPADPRTSVLLWFAAVAAVGVLGLLLAARLERLGQPVAVVGVLGLLAVLVSPVSWIHHLYWMIIVVGVLLGDARTRSRVVVAGVLALTMWVQLPWLGARLMTHDQVPRWLGRVLQNGYVGLSALALVAVWWFLVRPVTAVRGTVSGTEPQLPDVVRERPDGESPRLASRR
jgi:alpha-1,2-mannosyltransferase